MEITTYADFYWISSGLMNASLNYYRGEEGFYSVFACIQALAGLVTRLSHEEHHEYRLKAAAVVVKYECVTCMGREY